MSKYKGPKLKIIKKLGFLPGFTNKHIQKNIINQTKNLSISDNYKLKLIEKQKLRYNYCITNKQLKSYYLKAKKTKGSTVNILLNLLESRLDNIVFRLGFATTILEARQYINHCHILVNNKLINIASYNCKLYDNISIKNNFKSKQLILKHLDKIILNQNLINQRLIKFNLINFNYNLPSYLILNNKNTIGQIISNKKYTNILLKINELKVIEYYS
jgi:small subunit ribosomal protein S4